MIRRFLPPVILTVSAWLCVLACVGALASACAIGLSSLWGPVWGCLATAGLFALLACVFLLIARASIGRIEPPGAHLGEALMGQAEGIFKSHPVPILGFGALALYLLIRRPAIVARAGAAIARSTAFIMMIRKLTEGSGRRR